MAQLNPKAHWAHNWTPPKPLLAPNDQTAASTAAATSKSKAATATESKENQGPKVRLDESDLAHMGSVFKKTEEAMDPEALLLELD